MKIYCENTGRMAKLIKGPNDLVPVFKCFPPGSKKNTDDKAVKFERVADAADYLRRTAGGGIRVASNGTETGQNTAILNKNLIIEHDDGRKERV